MTVPPIDVLEKRMLLAFSPIQLGSKGYESGYEAAMDSQGNIVVAGLFAGKIDFNPGKGKFFLTAVGETDIYVAKYTSSGGLIWAGQIGGEISDQKTLDLPIDPERDGSFVNAPGIKPDTLGEHVNGIALDSSGNIFLTGTFLRTADFDPGPGEFFLTANPKYHLDDAFLEKLDPNGKLLWADSFGGQFIDVANAVAVDPQGNPVVTGYFTRSADFDPGPAVFTLDVTGRADIFVAKYTGNAGKFMWAENFGSDTTKSEFVQEGNSIAVDPTGNIIVTGIFAGKADFDPGPTQFILESHKHTDAFLLELSPRGKRVFAENIGGNGFAGGLEVAVRNGAIYTASYFSETIDANPGPSTLELTSAGDDRHTDLLVSKYTETTGVLNWAAQMGGEGFETIGGFGVAADGSVYLSGGFYGPADFDPGTGTFILTSVLGDENFKDPNDSGRDYSYDVYVVRLSTAGKLVNATRIGGDGDDFGTGLALSADGTSLALTGQFRNTVPFDSASDKFKLKSVGAQDSFLIELSEDLKLLT